MTAKETIDYEVRFLYEDTLVYQAIEWSELYRSKFIFIVDKEKKVLGYLVADILYELDDSHQIIDFIQPIEQRLIIQEDVHLLELLRKAELVDNYLLPIINSEKLVLGFCTANSLLNIFLKDNEILQKGGIITIETNIHNYSLSEIARIVESNDAIIFNVITKQISNENKLQVILKINRTDLKNIRATFERFEYAVLDIMHESEYDFEMQDRIDNLLKYLEI